MLASVGADGDGGVDGGVSGGGAPAFGASASASSATALIGVSSEPLRATHPTFSPLLDDKADEGSRTRVKGGFTPTSNHITINNSSKVTSW